MKILKYAAVQLFCVSATVIMSGCDAFLSVDPETNWDNDKFYANKDEVELGMVGIYNYLGQDATYGQAIPCMYEAGTDESVFNRTNASWAVAVNLHTPADPDIKKTWLALYSGIEAANNFMVKVPSTPGLTDLERNNYLAQARFMRALFYYDLVRLWGEVPLRLKPASGISDNNLAASSIEAVYNQIITDLELAARHLPHAKEVKEFGRANKMAAHGMLARVYLNMAGFPLQKTEMYAKASDQCDSVIVDGWHQLNTNGYKQVFMNYIKDINDPVENLFEVQFSNMKAQGLREDGRHGNINGVQFTYGGEGYPYSYGFMQLGVRMISLFEAGDERFDWNCASYKYDNKNQDVTRITSNLFWWPGKFRRWEPQNWADVDKKGKNEPIVYLENLAAPDKNFTGINFPLLRYADILLMKAECENEMNGPANAYGYVNQVRARAKASAIDEVSVPDQAAMRQFIRDERLRELCFEGRRKGDLIRWGILGQTLEAAKAQIESTSGYNAANANHTVLIQNAVNFSESRHLYLPYPLQEVTNNDLLDQRAGWQ